MLHAVAETKVFYSCTWEKKTWKAEIFEHVQQYIKLSPEQSHDLERNQLKTLLKSLFLRSYFASSSNGSVHALNYIIFSLTVLNNFASVFWLEGDNLYTKIK